MAKNTRFDLGVLTDKFSAIASETEKTGDIDIAKFADAINELTNVFECLGSTFAFAFKDLDAKIEALKFTAPSYSTASAVLDRDVAAGNKIGKDKPLDKEMAVCGTRALNRTIHTVVFLTHLFQQLIENPDKEIKPILQEIYPLTMARGHVFLVRQAVKAAFLASPKREGFLKNAGITKEMLEKEGRAFIKASELVSDKVEALFNDRKVNYIFT